MTVMHEYNATVTWSRNGAKFSDNQYSRRHEWRFDGGAVVNASSAPSSVPLPFSDASAVDPEEALVASLSSCHMLFFLAFAGKKGWLIDTYSDKAVGIMEKNADGKLAITRITLRPEIRFAGAVPTAQDIEAVHHLSHEKCYIANSIKAEVEIQSAVV